MEAAMHAVSRSRAVLPAALVLGVALAAAPALAQTPGAIPVPNARDGETGRFVLRDTPGGLLRMDTRTGHISLCTQSAGAFTCRLVADDRIALDQEIERLRAENEALKRGGATALARPGQPNADQGMNLPSDAEVDRALSLAERIWRRLRGIIRETEQEQGGRRL
jgi:hypothetical protein